MKINEYANYQLENYNKLGLRSVRGITMAGLLLPVLIDLVWYLVSPNRLNLLDLVFVAVINIPIAIFVYKGKRWAMFVSLLLNIFLLRFLFSYFATKPTTGSFTLTIVLGSLAIWFYILRANYYASKIELIRKNKKVEQTNSSN